MASMPGGMRLAGVECNLLERWQMDTMKSFGMRGAHVFDITFDKGMSIVWHLGQEIGRTRSGAIHLAARWLLAEGLAEPFHRIATFVDGVPSMSGQVGGCAAWKVREDDHGLHHVRFDPTIADRMREMHAA